MTHNAYAIEDIRALGRLALGEVMDDEQRRANFVALVDYGLSPKCKSRLMRTEALRIYYAACRDSGIERTTQLNQQIWIGVGGASESDVRRKVAIVNEADAMAPADQVVAMAQRLNELIAAEPDLHELLMDSLSRAYVELPPHTNGDAA